MRLATFALPSAVTLALLLAADSLASDNPAEVAAHRDLCYHEIPRDPDAARHRLDVYAPKRKKDCAVLFFVHGGGWTIGKKDDYFGVFGYGTVARCLAERGIVVVLPNYRLSPGVRHPEHIKDVARAFDWTCRHAAEYGGDPGRIFAGGHSAGGHLVALLAIDEKWLKEVGRSRKEIRGVIGLSGVYRLDGLRVGLPAGFPGGWVKASLEINPLAGVFGDDPATLRAASPLTHVSPGLPPFLLLNGGLDLWPLPPMAVELAAALKKNGCEVRQKVLPWKTHETLLFDIGRLTADAATAEEIVTFVTRKPGR